MTISAFLVKELRERTGAGMMDCKKALQDANGDIDVAIEEMRKSGAAKAAKKAGRIAAEGIIKIQQDAKDIMIIEINCESDFVAKDENFLAFADKVVEALQENNPASVDELLAIEIHSESLEESLQHLIARVGEKIMIRRFEKRQIENTIGSYLHGTRIGVIVDLKGGSAELAKDIAMHIAASKPAYISTDQVPQEVLDKEREVFVAQAAKSGKPAGIIEKMVIGRIDKFLKEITLLGQPFVKNTECTIEKLLKAADASVVAFIRYEVGEGIEKKIDNFAEEVMAQAKGR